MTLRKTLLSVIAAKSSALSVDDPQLRNSNLRESCVTAWHSMKTQWALTTACLAAQAMAAGQLDPLPLPPMGFNNWARFMTNINESIFVDAADAMAKNGLLAAGYNRLNLDDAWSTMSRAANGSMVCDAVKFPRGLPWLTKYMRSKGFVPGIYTDAGKLSCGGYPGALDHEKIDTRDFQAWGFEYLKMDGCNLPDDTEAKYHEIYSRWPRAIAASGKPLVFSNSAPAYFFDPDNLTDWYAVMGWAAEYGQLARHSADVATYPDGDGWSSIMYNYGVHVRLARFQRPGFFNDPDFLITDHPSLSFEEKKSHFALWCSFSAPLLLSVDIPSLSQDDLAFLRNKDLIAVNQDRLVEQATLVSRDDRWEVLTKSLENGDRLLTVLNRGAVTGTLKVPWDRIGLSSKAFGTASVRVKNLWTGNVRNVAIADGGIIASQVPSHGTAVFRITKSKSPVIPRGMVFNTLTLSCLTDQASGKVIWSECNASDAQVWAVNANGRVSSLLRPDACIVDDDGKIISHQDGCEKTSWVYKVSGNLISSVSGRCLTESANGTAAGVSCGHLLNEQVLALPVGVKVDRR
ncbi:alpha-N-acetylgalactosaminidase [Moelleriella libera RCEF 2490]|uniref:Alpha-galactosidase n=1 Tax=Moelleriella libera RCEF 2490 TaxID=1081109 RepID=A0A167ZR44_9HYPO|nr:alpha-N-acetylgalactosaminidase [Moelleriella libera RCEF 2490]